MHSRRYLCKINQQSYLIRNDRTCRDCGALYVTWFKIVATAYSTASASVMTIILKAVAFEKRRAFGMMINSSNERDTRLL